ncbi:hypothetical protein [uncultured Brachybacterium sp.]|uniref:hypothetical protein n=1 Tax=uncultured Brachybacterium sp. TaxID=189680 RepID=UPI0026147DB9|nr:hypothetical protein [uncultured Brachybacterium sp.]
MLEPGAAAVGCLGPASTDRIEPNQEWIAHAVMVPSGSGFQNGSSVAVLFSTGTELPQEADDLLNENVALTGLGFGSVDGMDALSADDVAASTLDCEARTADSTTWDLVLAPGTYLDNDHGLLVGIDRTSDD